MKSKKLERLEQEEAILISKHKIEMLEIDEEYNKKFLKIQERYIKELENILRNL